MKSGFRERAVLDVDGTLGGGVNLYPDKREDRILNRTALAAARKGRLSFWRNGDRAVLGLSRSDSARREPISPDEFEEMLS